MEDARAYPNYGDIHCFLEFPRFWGNYLSFRAEFPRPRCEQSVGRSRIPPTSARTVRAQYPPHGGIANTPHTGVLKQMRKHTKIIPPTSVRLVEAKFPRHRRAWPDQTHRGRGNSLKREFPRTRRNSSKHAYPPYGGIHVRLPQQGSLFKRDFMTD